MVWGLSKLSVAALAVVGVFVLSPAAALADTCQGGTSVVNIYSECTPSPGGGHHHNRGNINKRSTTATPTYPTTPVYPTTPPPVTVNPAHKVSKNVRRSIAQTVRAVTAIVGFVTPTRHATQTIYVPASYRATPPSALGAFFDLGSGPMALFAMLAAVAILLLGGGVLRARRHKL